MKNPKEVKFTWVRFGKASLGDWYVSRGYTYKWVMTSVSEKEYDIYTRTETPAEAWKPGTGEEYLYILQHEPLRCAANPHTLLEWGDCMLRGPPHTRHGGIFHKVTSSPADARNAKPHTR